MVVEQQSQIVVVVAVVVVVVVVVATAVVAIMKVSGELVEVVKKEGSLFLPCASLPTSSIIYKD